MSAEPKPVIPHSAEPSATPPARRAMLRTALLVLVGGVLGVGSMHAKTAWQKSGPPPADPSAGLQVEGDTIILKPDAPQQKYLEFSTATTLAPLPRLSAPGRIVFDPLRASAVSCPLTGRVESTRVRPGDAVRKGERMVAVRSADWAQLASDILVAESTMLLKRKVAQRTRELVEIKAAPERELVAAEAELHNSELAWQSLQARRDSLQIEAADSMTFWLLAPRSGTVVELAVSEGEEVAPGRDKPLLRIANLDEVLVVADVQEREAADIKIGAAVEVRNSAGDVTSPGVVEYVPELIDPTRYSIEVRARVDNRQRQWRPNGFVDVTFAAAQSEQRVQVPSEAVVTDGKTSVVFTVDADGRIHRTPVVTKRQDRGVTELLRGLDPGMRYVSHGALLLLNQLKLSE